MNQNRRERLEKFKSSFRLGELYRTSELMGLSNNLSRDLSEMITQGWLKQPSPGIYYKSKTTWFGDLPANTQKLLAKFLKSDLFILVDFNKYNALGLGTTQLHNKQVVYNHKRHGKFSLDGVEYEFKRVPQLPKKLDKEFLLVDMINNFKQLGEDFDLVLVSLKKNWKNFDSKRVLKLSSLFGKVATRKLFTNLAKEDYVSA